MQQYVTFVLELLDNVLKIGNISARPESEVMAGFCLTSRRQDWSTSPLLNFVRDAWRSTLWSSQLLAQPPRWPKCTGGPARCPYRAVILRVPCILVIGEAALAANLIMRVIFKDQEWILAAQSPSKACFRFIWLFSGNTNHFVLKQNLADCTALKAGFRRIC